MKIPKTSWFYRLKLFLRVTAAAMAAIWDLKIYLGFPVDPEVVNIITGADGESGVQGQISMSCFTKS